MSTPLGAPRGWMIDEEASCIRCRRTGGDHHACWLDRCREATGEHQGVQVHGIRGDVVDLGPHGALRRQMVAVSVAQRRAWGLE